MPRCMWTNRTTLTTQFCFDDDISERVYAQRPYSKGEGHDTTNASDGLFDRSLLLDLSRDGEGYLGVISLDVQTA
jgi:hypothetical protein